MKNSFAKGFSITALAAALAACGGGFSDGSSTGSLSLGITDAPVDSLEEVVVTVTGVAVKPAGGQAVEFSFEEPKVLDLLTLQGGNSASLLDEVEVITGSYQWIRLDLSEESGDLYVIDDAGNQYNLFVPSGAQSGLKLNRGFTVPAGGLADFTIDFDVRKSVTERSDNQAAPYVLRPTLRLIDNVQAGTIAGTVDYNSVVQPNCADPEAFAGVVYVFDGADVTPDDFDAVSSGALVAVPVNQEGGIYSYRAAFLPAGHYTVAYSCDQDNMEQDEDLTFIGTTNAAVVQKKVTEVDFPAAN